MSVLTRRTLGSWREEVRVRLEEFRSEHNPLVVVFLAAGVCCVSLVMVGTNGNLFLALAAVAAIGLAIVSLKRIDLGFSLFVGVVLLSDVDRVPGFWPMTFTLRYFNNFNANPFLQVPGGVISPMELHLICLFAVWFIMVAIQKQHVRFNKVPVPFPAFILAIWIIMMFGYGLSRGGDLTWGLWQTRALFYLFILLAITPQIIQTREQIETLLWICIGAITVKAVQGAQRFASLGFSFQGFFTLTNHDDPVYFITLFMLLAGFLMWNVKTVQSRVLLWLTPVLLLGFFAGNRRATYSSWFLTIVAFTALVGDRERKIMFRLMKWGAVVAVLYLVVFWNSYGTLGNIAQQVKAELTGEQETVRANRDYMSDLYRKWEDYNLAVTFRGVPIEGLGFGRKYETPLVWWNFLEATPIMAYTPHNQLIWMASTMGTVGFFWFLLFFNTFLFQASHVFTSVNEPFLKAVCALIIVSVINQLVVTYFDMQLTWPRNMVYLGVLMGLMSSVHQISHAEEERALALKK
ncbi:MAG TPA: hypothetical protein VMF59_11415 [Bacteroidota bacterium]|nr:hypothetical protein [Bacteroidota bacterium]